MVANGFAKAYLLSGRKPFSAELEGMPLVDLPETEFKTYFYITRKGMSELDERYDTVFPQCEHE